MATPTGARHRDLEQRLRDIEAGLRQLNSTALSRKQLSVTSGDFVVSGGGDVVVEDGGRVRALYASGRTSAELGQLDEGATAADAFGARFLPDEDAPAGLSNALLEMFDAPSTGQVLRAFVDGFATFRGASGVIVSCGALGAASSASVTVTSTGVAVSGGLDADDVVISPAGTTASAANVRITGVGRLLEVTSSRRYKRDIEAAPDRATELLAVQGRTWRDRSEVAEDPDTETRHVGYIAEELHDAGLTEYVDYDHRGQPHAIQYDRLTVPLLQLAQRQQDQLDAQAAQIADLVRRVDDLEPKPYPYA